MSYPICRHIMTNGDQCQSPRLREEDFCYFHHRTRLRHQAMLDARRDTEIINTEGEVIGWGQPVGFEDRRLPNLGPLEDRASVQMAIASVVNALLTGRISQSKASTLLYGLQLASSNFPRRQHDFRNPASNPVAEVERAPDGTLLAPADPVRAAMLKEQEERRSQQAEDETEEVELSHPVLESHGSQESNHEASEEATAEDTGPGEYLYPSYSPGRNPEVDNLMAYFRPLIDAAKSRTPPPHATSLLEGGGSHVCVMEPRIHGVPNVFASS